MRPKFTFSYFFAFAIALGGSIGGCDSATRHRYLTYFIDGVPPLDSEQGARDDTESTQQSGQAGTEESDKVVWFVHEPRKACTNCHSARGTQSDLATARLIKPVPDLCIDCHEEYRVAQLFVHGPTIAGECLFCHEPHKSKIKYLLKEGQPELCYRCHEVLESNPIPEHPSNPKLQCTECHDPHGGSDRYFLRN